MLRHSSKFALGLLAGLCVFAMAPTANAAEALQFTIDPAWPKTLPNNWTMGQIGGMTVDAQDNIWVLQRPRTRLLDIPGPPGQVDGRVDVAVGREQRSGRRR